MEMPAFYSVPMLRRGDIHPQVADFRRTLMSKYPAAQLSDTTSQVFDGPLEAAVVSYQWSVGVEPSGVVTEPTWAKLLGVPVDQVAGYDLGEGDETPPEKDLPRPPSGGSPLLWVALAAAAAWALS